VEFLRRDGIRFSGQRGGGDAGVDIVERVRTGTMDWRRVRAGGRNMNDSAMGMNIGLISFYSRTLK
jgi:hypothetical protein